VQSKVVDPEVVLWVFFYVLIVELRDISKKTMPSEDNKTKK
jgi:hypothetical protein